MPAPDADRSPWRRRALHAVAVGIASIMAFAIAAPTSLFTTHTAYDHFSLLADAWLSGRLDLGGPPPDYTGGNDFAVFGPPGEPEKVFVSFPPFPAVLLLPFVAIAGSAEGVPDGLIFLVLAGIGPAMLFIALERLCELGRSPRGMRENVLLAMLFALGTVYFSTAVQGTVWFAAHVVGVACCTIYLAAGIDGERPLIAGAALALGIATRTPLLFAIPFFVAELLLRARREEQPLAWVVRRAALFAAPIAVVLAILAWHNAARFGDPFEFGHRHLAVVWQDRIQRWGLFSPHYLGRNLGVALAATPFWGAPGEPMRIGGHGLAMWITSPFLLWLLASRPRRVARGTCIALGITALAVAAPSLLYQNTGWIQFGYRFSSDFAPMMILALAMARPRLGPGFAAAAALSVAINAFGAFTFQRPQHARFYAHDRSALAIFEPD